MQRERQYKISHALRLLWAEASLRGQRVQAARQRQQQAFMRPGEGWRGARGAKNVACAVPEEGALMSQGERRAFWWREDQPITMLEWKVPVSWGGKRAAPPRAVWKTLRTARLTGTKRCGKENLMYSVA